MISAAELAAVAAAVGTFGAADASPTDSFFDGLLERAQKSAGSNGEWSSEVGEGPPSLDFTAFARIMTSKAVTEYTRPEFELKPAFSSLDANGDGVICKAELLSAVEAVCANMANSGAGFSAMDVEDAFDAADVDRDGLIDYQEFVAVMSDMGVSEPNAVGEQVAFWGRWKDISI